MPQPTARLSRRERQIVEILYRLGRASVAEVPAALPDPPPTVTATRSALWLLCEKGHVRRDQSGPRNVYLPAVAPETARASALRDVLDTFCDGSRGRAAAAILGDTRAALSDDDIAELEELLDRHKRRKRGR